MKTLHFIIILILIFILTGIVGFSFYQMWNRDSEEVVIVYETYQNKVKLNCTDLRLNLRKLLGEHSSLIREYILITLNSHSYDEKMTLHEYILQNIMSISQQFGMICGDNAGKEINKYLTEYLSNLSNILNYFSVSEDEEKEDFSILLSKINATITNLSIYLCNILYTKRIKKEEKKEEELSQLKMQKEIKELLSGHNDLIQSQIKYYNAGGFSHSVRAYLSDVEVMMGISDYLTTKLCDKSKENKKKE